MQCGETSVETLTIACSLWLWLQMGICNESCHETIYVYLFNRRMRFCGFVIYKDNNNNVLNGHVGRGGDASISISTEAVQKGNLKDVILDTKTTRWEREDLSLICNRILINDFV